MMWENQQPGEWGGGGPPPGRPGGWPMQNYANPQGESKFSKDIFCLQDITYTLKHEIYNISQQDCFCIKGRQIHEISMK